MKLSILLSPHYFSIILNLLRSHQADLFGSWGGGGGGGYGPADAYRMLTSCFQLPQEPRERSIATIFFNCSDKLVPGTKITVTLCILTTWLLHNQIIITKANLTPDHFLT